MAYIEVDEAEIQQLRGVKQLHDKLLSDPKTRRSAQNLIKEAFPGQNIRTDDDIAAPYVNEMREGFKKMDAFLEQQQQREQDREAEAAFNRLKGEGFTEEGIAEVKKIMVERKVGDPEVAAGYWNSRKPAPMPMSGLQPNSWGFGGKTDDVDTKSLFENEDAWAEREAIKVYNEG